MIPESASAEMSIDAPALKTELKAAQKPESRLRRWLVFAPTATSGFLLAFCFFLPVGVFGGCNNAQRVVTPYERHTHAWQDAGLVDLAIEAFPYVFGLLIGLGTLAVCASGTERAFRRLWMFYGALVVVPASSILAILSFGLMGEDDWSGQGFAIVSIFWLLNLVLAVWLECHTAFLAAMMLQLVLVLLIWLGLAHWLLFLEQLLIGGYLTVLCVAVLPLGTALQLFGDPAASRASLRTACASARRNSSLPQFGLFSLLAAMSFCAVCLTLGKVWGMQAALSFAFVATFIALALRRQFANRGKATARSRMATGWYAFVACSIAIGALLSISAGD